MELIDILRSTDLFHGLKGEQLQRLAEISRRQSYDEDEIIFNADDPGDTMYVITEGQVEVRLPGSIANRAELYLGEGQIFGEVALLDEGKRSATIIAAQDGTVVHSIPRDLFIQLCQADTALGYLVMRNLALDLSFKLRHRNFDDN